MKDFILIKHASGAPGLRLLGLGPNLLPLRGLEKLQALFEANTSWAKKRDKQDIKKMLSRSEVVISVWKDKKLIGFGRATSDKVYRAVLWDIVVEKSQQNIGIGKKIVYALLSNNLISNVEKIYIMTTKFESFYSKMGFKWANSQKLMFIEN
tara:strand:- start:88 stop:543 length:456 start_codon:yes stop_codon:yes gene_type:complete